MTREEKVGELRNGLSYNVYVHYKYMLLDLSCRGGG